MSHVDSGALHAYLDGALDEYPASDANWIREHLDACAACAGRLEEERTVRAAAQGILDQAVPTVDLPSLEELRAYVKATRPVASRVSVTIYRLGWAASVVLAVGVGWVARGGSPEATEMQMAPAMAPSADVSEPEPAALVEVARPRVAPDQELGGSAPATTVAERPAVTEVAEERTTLPAAPAEPEVVASLDELVTDDAVDEMLRELEAPTAAFAPSDVVASGAGAGDAEPRPGNLIEIVPAPAPARAAEEARRAVPTDRREVAAARLDVSSAAGLRQAELPEADAEFYDHDMELDAIPGVEVVSFASLEEMAGHALVQRLEDGRLVDVFHLRPGVNPDDVLPEDSGRSEIRQERTTGWIVLRSEVSMTELRELLARFPAGS